MKYSAQRNDGRYFKFGNQFTNEHSERMLFAQHKYAELAIIDLYKLWKWGKHKGKISPDSLKAKIVEELSYWTITEEEDSLDA